MGERLVRTHRDLEVYRLAFDAAMRVFEVSKTFPKEERYSLTDQMRRSSRSVCSNLAEAWRKRRYEAAFVLKLNDSEAEAAETQTWIEFAVACGYLDKKSARDLYRTYNLILGKIVTMIQPPGAVAHAKKAGLECFEESVMVCASSPLRLRPSAPPPLCAFAPLRLRPSASPPLCASAPLHLRPSAPPPLRPSAPPPLCTTAEPMSILLIFVDGVGIGTRGEHNPLDGLGSEFFSIFRDEQPLLPFGGVMSETDARLGVDGLPQSATGQTAILTGVNAAKLIGRHLHGYPSPRLKQALAEHSIYKKLIAQGRSVTFANAYTRSYVDNPPRFISSTTVAAQTAGVRLRMLEDLQQGRAVSHDFTNRFLIERGFEVDMCTAETAGARLAVLAASHDFTLYEHFITDRIGHARRGDLARDHMLELTRFVRAVLEAADLSRQTVILTSDHGNIEDLSTRSHTLNPVATLAFGAAGEQIVSRVRSLTDIAPAIVDSLAAKSTAI